MKVLLSTIPVKNEETYSHFAFAAPKIPTLGLAYIAAVLEKNQIGVKIIDCIIENKSLEDLKKEIINFDPDLIGLTCNTPTYSKARETISFLKATFPDKKIILGGPHVSALKKDVLTENPLLDIGVYGEGEYTFLEIVKGKPLNKIKGIIFRKKTKIFMNPPRPLIKDLDKLPYPARHLLPNLELYAQTPMRHIKGAMISMVTSRGCPFSCTYCDQAVFGRTWRAHSVDYILKEIKSIKEPISFVSFEDDNFTLDKKRLVEFCEKKDFNFLWSCSLRIDSVNEDLLKLMKKSGCRILYFGLESGNQDLLDSVNKKIRLKDVKNKLQLIKKIGLQSYGSFIIGLPGETKTTIKETLSFALNLPLDGASFNLFVPYPNTPLRIKSFEKGSISDDWRLYSDHSSRAPFIPKGFTQEELLKAQKKAYKKFYLRPKYILTHLDTFMNKDFLKKAVRAAIKLIK